VRMNQNFATIQLSSQQHQASGRNTGVLEQDPSSSQDGKKKNSSNKDTIPHDLVGGNICIMENIGVFQSPERRPPKKTREQGPNAA